ncbi:MAG TPA: aminofutalosine synthase MqnE, partial [Verrucomicrobiae bacterium]|nr:aminofutalosine synthase MqnE [Verrucomicrobiae bacterium]
MNELFAGSELKDIIVKVEQEERLSFADGVRLFKSNDLLAIGYMADLVRKRKNGDTAYFISNRHINHTNICVNRCKLCSFGVDKDAPNAYTMDLAEIEQKALEMRDKQITEVHIVGGLNPELPFEYFIDMMRRVSQALPGVHIQAFTAVEIDYFAETTGLSPREVLAKLMEAGLGSLPGGGAEVFAPRVREKICEKKVSGERWLEIMEAAHSLGMRTNATMLYGHVETIEERVDHFVRLRELQDRTGGFLTFIPLAFQPKHTVLAESMATSRTTGFEDIKMLAIARLMLDNFDHIKAYWVMIGFKLAQVSLAFGV